MQEPVTWGSEEMREDPFPYYEHVRAMSPVLEVPERDMYVLTKREDIEFVLLHPELFTVKGRSPTKTYPGQRYPTMLDLSNVDPPAHKALRAAYLKLLSPRRIAELRPLIEAKAHSLIDAFADEPEVEIVAAFARPLPCWFMGTLLAIPEALHEQVERWAFDYFDLLDSNLHHTVDFGDTESRVERSFTDFMNFCGDLVMEWRENPPEGSLGDFAMSRKDDGELFSIDELANQVRLLISGSQTTIHAITQAIVDAVRLDDRTAIEDDKVLGLLIEESIRKDGPSTYLPRRPLEDLEINGVKIPAGKRILLSVQSGNHDEEFFGCPTHFDLERPNLKRHIGFGLGIHLCVGAPTARVETTVALKTLFARFRTIRLAADNEYLHRTDLTGMRFLKAVRLELAA
jgi:cytochrome P450